MNPFYTQWTAQYGLPPFEQFSYEDYLPALREGIARQKAEIEAITGNPAAPDFENTVGAYERSGALLAKVCGVLFNLSITDNCPEFEAIMDEAVPLLTGLENEIGFNRALFQRVETVYKGDRSHLDREQQMVLKKLYDRMARNGVGLPAGQQERLREINTRMAVDQQQFSQHLLAENNAFEQACGIAVSAYPQAMTETADRAVRKKMFEAYSSRGNHGDDRDNKGLVLDIMKLRAEKARILGYSNFAAYQLADKMAAVPEKVDTFLAEIMEASMAHAREDAAAMQELMDADIAAGKLPPGSRIAPWDWFYYAEKVRKARYDLDEHSVMPYFVLENVRDGAFAVAEKAYGIHIRPLPGVPVYHPEVKAFEVSDADGSLLGVLYTDYLPRPGKCGGAWMNNFRDQYVDAEGREVRPVIVNVGNLNPPVGNQPSLLTIDQVTTLFHEFGHALHGLLTRCRYRSVSGTSVAQDFVETFSQFNENWAFQKEVLPLYARHYQTGELIPDELAEKIRQTAHFNQGFQTGEVCAASILDMKWHEMSLEALQSLQPGDIAGLEDRFCREMGLIAEIIPRYRSTYFSHIFDNDYCAGYYGYLWSEVLDQDAWDYFRQKGLFCPEVCQSFRRIFLEKGGSEEPMALYLQFRGQEPDPAALLRSRGLTPS